MVRVAAEKMGNAVTAPARPAALSASATARAARHLAVSSLAPVSALDAVLLSLWKLQGLPGRVFPNCNIHQPRGNRGVVLLATPHFPEASPQDGQHLHMLRD